MVWHDWEIILSFKHVLKKNWYLGLINLWKNVLWRVNFFKNELWYFKNLKVTHSFFLLVCVWIGEWMCEDLREWMCENVRRKCEKSGVVWIEVC